MKPAPQAPEICECGNPLPCDLHTPVYDQALAFTALRRLNAAERALVLCWFCRWCHRYLAPGQPRLSCDQGGCQSRKDSGRHV